MILQDDQYTEMEVLPVHQVVLAAQMVIPDKQFKAMILQDVQYMDRPQMLMENQDKQLPDMIHKADQYTVVMPMERDQLGLVK